MTFAYNSVGRMPLNIRILIHFVFFNIFLSSNVKDIISVSVLNFPRHFWTFPEVASFPLFEPKHKSFLNTRQHNNSAASSDRWKSLATSSILRHYNERAHLFERWRMYLDTDLFSMNFQVFLPEQKWLFFLLCRKCFIHELLEINEETTV